MAARTFRVFVSSTFSDLKEERNVLARWVFPRLRALCESRGYRFQAMDLRWGVRDEAAADQQTVRICLDEIARCQKLSPKPNFIVLLGDRYGWRPPPRTIGAQEMEMLRSHLAAEAELIFGNRNAPSNAAEVRETGWYRLDKNAVPPEWVLQPRRGVYEDEDEWEPIERQLRESITRAAAAAGVPHEERQLHGASATDLEIVEGALKVPDARDHVFAFVRSITNNDAVAAALPAKAAADLLDVRDGVWDRDAWAKRNALEAALRERLGADNVWPYAATWKDGRLDRTALGAPPPGTTATPDKIEFAPGTLCYEVFTRLSHVIVAQMDALDGQDRDALKVEQDAHAYFAKGRLEGFKGRERPLGKIAQYVAGDAPRPLVVYGDSGSGKSALMARAIEDARAAYPNAVVIGRFIGAVLGSSEARPLLEGLCRELCRAFGGDESTIDGRYEKLVRDFPQRLGLGRADKPVVLFVDALDQLGDMGDGRRLAWLPRTLPPHVRIVVSTLPDEQYICFPELSARADAQDLLQLEKLSIEDGGKVLDAWLEGLPARRTVTEAQRAEVLRRFRENGLPLYLRLAFEEARRWHSYDGAPAGGLGHDIPGLIRSLFARLSRQHGDLAVGRALGFLAASRHGLSDDEILALLWRDKDVKEDFDRNKHHDLPEGDAALPPIVWSRLYFDLEPYLAQREVFGVGLLAFYHRQLGEVAADAHLAGDRRRVVHGALADYFTTRWQVPDTHALLELVGQLLSAGRDSQATRLLLEYEWCAKKLATTDVQLLLADYRELRCERHHPVSLIAMALQLSSYALAARPAELAAHQVGRLQNFSDPALRLHVEQARASISGPSLVPRGRGLTAPGGALTLSIDAHEGGVQALAISRDGARLISCGPTNRATTPDQSVKVWSADTGQLLLQLAGHHEGAHTVCCTPDDRMVISASDGTLRAWDARTGKALWIRKARASGLALLSDGRTLVVSSRPGIQIWDLAKAKAVRCFAEDRGARDAMAVTPDERVVAYSLRRTPDLDPKAECIVIKDLASATTLRTLEVGAHVTSLAFSPDGRSLVTASTRRTLIVWNLETGREVRRMTGCSEQEQAIDFADWYGSLAVLPDGKTCIAGSTGSHHSGIHIWNLESGALLRTLRGHSDRVDALLVTDHGRGLVSGSSDGTIKKWDLSLSDDHDDATEHGASIDDVAVARDGTRVVTGSHDDSAMKIWEHESLKLLRTIESLDGCTAPLSLSPDGETFVSGPVRVKLWETRSGRLLRELEGHQSNLGVVQFLSGDIVLIGRWASNLAARDARNGRLLFEFPVSVPSQSINAHSLAVSTDGRLAFFTSHSMQPSLWVYDVERRLPLHVMLDVFVRVVAVAPNSRLAATGSADALSWWDLASGTMLGSVRVNGGVACIAFSQCGRFTISISGTAGKLHVWGTESGQLLSTFTGDVAFTCVAAPLSGPERLVAGDAAGRLHSFDFLIPSHASQPGIWASRAKDSSLASSIPATLQTLQLSIEEALTHGRADFAKSLLSRQAFILDVCGEFEDALELHRRRQQICAGTGDGDGVVRSLGEQATLLSKMGRRQEAEAASGQMRLAAQGRDLTWLFESVARSFHSNRGVGVRAEVAEHHSTASNTAGPKLTVQSARPKAVRRSGVDGVALAAAATLFYGATIWQPSPSLAPLRGAMGVVAVLLVGSIFLGGRRPK